MGAKRWQLEERDKEIKKLREQVVIANEALAEIIEYLERDDFKLCKIAKRARSKIIQLEEAP